MNVQVKAKLSTNPLKHLNDFGQAVWLDFLARKFTADGGLKKLVDQDGLTGVTSNPSIFEKAIVGSQTNIISQDLRVRVSPCRPERAAAV